MANSRKSKRSDFPGRVEDLLAPLVSPGSSILLGLSGGVDSVALLHILRQLATRFSWRFSALHVHHGISPRADEWAAFCTGLCDKYGIPLTVERVDIGALRPDMGIEAAARELRHQALMRQRADFIALAHHQDDQAETLLLQLLRGAGTKGAAAMPVLKWRQDGPALLRPLLGVPRAELVAYAFELGLQWVEDESNADEDYPRNFLRHRVLPLLEQRFPAYRDTLARGARHFAEAAELLDTLAEQDAQDSFDGASLAVSKLSELGPARAKNLLRWFLQQRGTLLPDHTRLEEMLHQLCNARLDAQVCIGWADWEVRRYRGRAYVCSSSPELNSDLRILWHSDEKVPMPQLGGELHFERGAGVGLSLERLQAAPVTIRTRDGGERLRPDSARPTRSLKYLFQEAGIPPWQRPYWPLVYCGEILVAVPGVALEAAYRARPGELGVEVKWRP